MPCPKFGNKFIWDEYMSQLTYWVGVTHIRVSNRTIIGSDNWLSPGGHQAIIWGNAWILLIVSLGTNFSEILFEIQTFSFEKRRLEVSSVRWRPFWVGLNELNGLVGYGIMRLFLKYYMSMSIQFIVSLYGWKWFGCLLTVSQITVMSTARFDCRHLLELAERNESSR